MTSALVRCLPNPASLVLKHDTIILKLTRDMVWQGVVKWLEGVISTESEIYKFAEK
jgi:hypothetical protein